jgi:hypothetical protein
MLNRKGAKGALAVEAVPQENGVEERIEVAIEERPTEKFRQERRIRQGRKTRYIRQEGVRFDLS